MKVDNRIWVIITAFVCVVIVAGGWFLGVEPRLAAAAKATESLKSVEAQNDLTRMEIARLEKASKQSEELNAQLAELRAAIPPGVEGSDFISALDQLIASNGVTIKSVTLSEPMAYSVTPNAEGAVPPSDPLITSDNFVIVPIQISVVGANDAVLNFLAALQAHKRLILVTAVDKDQDDGDAEQFELAVAGNIYVLRDPVAEA